jgi:hypothetical protein
VKGPAADNGSQCYWMGVLSSLDSNRSASQQHSAARATPTATFQPRKPPEFLGGPCPGPAGAASTYTLPAFPRILALQLNLTLTRVSAPHDAACAAGYNGSAGDFGVSASVASPPETPISGFAFEEASIACGLPSFWTSVSSAIWVTESQMGCPLPAKCS